MIESIINPENVEKRPWEAFIAGFLFTIVACLLVLQMGMSGHEGAGFLIVAFISIAAAPFFVRMFDIEEKKEKKKGLFSRHDQIIQVYAFFFLSVILASSLIYVLMTPYGDSLFIDQAKDLKAKGIIKAQATAPVTYVTMKPGFFEILKNNLTILLLAFIFSLMLGAGAVFLISWNATVIGTLIGKIAENPQQYGFIAISNSPMINYLVALPMTLLKLLPHGMFEFAGYFFGAVAGGILSVAIVKNRFISFQIKQPLIDSAIYLALSAFLIFIGAVIEVIV